MERELIKREVRGITVSQLMSIFVGMATILFTVIMTYSKIMNAIDKGRDNDNIQETQIQAIQMDIKSTQQQIQINSTQILMLKEKINDLFGKEK